MSSSGSSERVTVLGAGVIGLTSALLLAEAGFSVDIVARDLPSDSTSQQFASPWAGAVWRSFLGKGPEDEAQRGWEEVTYKKTWSMVESGIAKKFECLDYSDSRPDLWFQELVHNYRELASTEIPKHVKFGVSYDTWTVSAPDYIQWLAAKLKTLNVPMNRALVTSLDDPYLRSFAPGLTPASIVVNATGLGSKSLIGVEDQLVHPVRGQTILISAPHLEKVVMHIDDHDAPPTYIIPRPNGECILGGTFLEDDWSLAPDPETTRTIIKNTLAFEPSLALSHSNEETVTNVPDVPIIKVNVGLRPSRRGGARLEKEIITVPFERKPYTPRPSNVAGFSNSKEVTVVHAYGLGGSGFQASWGMAEAVVTLVQKGGAQMRWAI